MSRICELTGKGRQVGHNVSHANNKTKRTFLPNLQNVTLMSESLEKSVKLRVSTHGLRSVEHVGGLDNWVAKTKAEKLSPRVRKLKREAPGLFVVPGHDLQWLKHPAQKGYLVEGFSQQGPVAPVRLPARGNSALAKAAVLR